MAFDTLAAAELKADCAPPPVAGLNVSFLISPRFLLSLGRSCGTETGPEASDTPRWGVTASWEGEGEGAMESRLRPLVFAGVAFGPASSGARKRTRIFFSWIEDLLVCSMCDHYNKRLGVADSMVRT